MRCAARNAGATSRHAYPSAGMLTDALVQYLVAKRWRDVLVLHGPAAADALTVAALHRSAAKFGVTILLQHRFERLAAPRRMNDEASAAWIAVKAVTQAVLRTSTTDFAALRGFILDDAINLDGSKGNRMSFRAWDQQLRQPILLATADAVIARARRCRTSCTDERPRHLGQDAAESACRF